MLRNCPSEFYINCWNAMRGCRACGAGSGSPSDLLNYNPREDIGEHPYKAQQTKSRERSQVVRRAQKTEEKVAKEIVRGTIRSGAVLGDGDHHILQTTLNLRQEVKDRGKRSSWNVTWAEYQKGKQQGIDVYAISSECPDGKRRTMYCMEEETYTELLAIAKKYWEQNNDNS